MERIRFKTKLDGDTIKVPREFRKRLGHREVEISISDAKEIDGLQQLLSHPLSMKDFKLPSRDEIYDRGE
jgi:hypothetical protein